MVLGAVLLGAGLSAIQPARAQDQTATTQTQVDAPSLRSVMGFNTPRLPLNRDAAALSFAGLLEFLARSAGKPETGAPRDAKMPDAAMTSSFSQSSENQTLPVLLLKMAVQWSLPQQKVVVQSEGDKTATVVIETPPITTSRPLVMVQEGETWGVDVLETYAKWNGLEGAAKVAAIAQLSTEFNVQREQARRTSCQSNLKQMCLGALQYAQDYNEKMPVATTWIDTMMPYIKSEQIFRCPSIPDPKGFGYAMNFNLSRRNLAEIPSPAQTILFYETTDLERNSYGIGEEPAFRHLNGANYAFADGHVKWLAQTAIPSFKLKP